MGKGYPRGMSRGDALRQEVIKQSIVINDTLTITGVDSAVDAGTLVIAGLPQGNIKLLAAVAYVALDATDSVGGVADNYDGDYGIGTVPQNDLDLGDAGDDNIIPSTAISAGASDKIVPLTRGVSTATEEIIIDNTAGDLELNLNVLIDDNVITDTEDGTFVVTGVVHLAYILLGDD